MRQTHKQGYTPGDYWVECPRCGFDYLKSEMKVEPGTGKEVCPRCVDDPPETKSQRTNW